MSNHSYEKETITVTVAYHGERDLRPFYCCRCGKCVCELTGDVRDMTPGTPDEATKQSLGISFARTCNGAIFLSPGNRTKCTAKYLFN